MTPPKGLLSPGVSPWVAFEAIPGLVALPSDWHAYMGDLFPAFRRLCLEPASWLAQAVYCPLNCGCSHRIVLRHDKTAAIAVCRCRPPHCPDLHFTIPGITPLQVDRPKLARAIARAFACTHKYLDLPVPGTTQIGSWSSAAIPLILAIHVQPSRFRQAVAELTLRLQKPFALLAPTRGYLDAASLELLSHAHAEFFDLASTVTLDPNGLLHPVRPPAALFAPFAVSTLSPESAKSRCRLSGNSQLSTSPGYSLRKDCGVWHLVFNRQEAYIKHERGMLYVAYLLIHPPEEPIHALDLLAKIPDLYRHQLGLPEFTDPTSGKTVTLQSHARLQERSLALDHAQSMRALFRKQKELEAVLDSDHTSEPEKAEALHELEQLSDYQLRHARTSADAAHRAANAVRKSIHRLHQNLLASKDASGNPHPVLRAFAQHLHLHLITPSSSRQAHGCLLYRSPATTWAS